MEMKTQCQSFVGLPWEKAKARLQLPLTHWLHDICLEIVITFRELFSMLSLNYYACVTILVPSGS
jgi:hypothetical protein